MKKVLVTWASDWLWLGFAKLLIDDWIEVVNLSRRKPPIDIYHIETSIDNEESINKAVYEIQKQHSQFDALIHCVGAVSYNPVDQISFQDMAYDLNTNIVWMTTLTSLLIPLIQENEADIMIVWATLWFKAMSQQAWYTAWTWWKRWVARYFQLELKDTPCRVISFCPWGMVTKMHEKVTWMKADPKKFMPVEWIAKCMKQILELPKYMEVSEIVINRKVANI